ncbi:MAG TPA: hypothetical protein VLF60_05660 [Candidatus Saccharimonadales bacterium]|nr:hypothetical protein [Candidatus Saccharimonadales bacterium]
MKRGQTIFLAAIVIAIIVGVVVTLLPVPAAWQGSSAEFHFPVAAYSSMACLHIGAVLLFLMGLSVYKAQLRRAYVMISIGIVAVALGTLQISLLSGLDALDSGWSKNGGAVVPFVLSSLLLYLGIRSFAKLVGLRNLFTRSGIVLPVVIVLCGATAFLPHVHVTTTEIGFDVGSGISTWDALLTLVSLLLMLQVRKHIGAHYTQAMTWLVLPLFTSFLILTVELVHSFFATSTTDLLSTMVTASTIISGLLWLRAGYAFAQTTEY